MTHARHTSLTAFVVALSTLVACNKEQRANADSAAGAVVGTARAALSVIDVDMGRHVDAEKKISDKTDDFSARDTIYASVHTSGTANNGAVVGRWTYQDGTVLDEKTNMVTTDGDARTVFYIAKPGGFAKGKYTLHVVIDGKAVRSKDVEVK
jgi:hypothetical protein